MPLVQLVLQFNRLNPENWKSGLTPQAGFTVSFPDSFSEFGADRCTTSNTPCAKGGIISIQASSPGVVAVVTMSRLLLPINGRIQLVGNTALTFVEGAPGLDPNNSTAEWLDRGPSGIDFACANNWVVQGTASNPDFIIPCYEDKAAFPTVRNT